MAFITSENARQLGSIGGKAERKGKVITINQCFSFAPSTDSHSKRTLSRVRKQIRTTLTMLEAETNPQSIDRLASALARLNEIERQLANRPLPGSWKPQAPKQVKAARAEPIALPQAISPAQPAEPPRGQ